MSQNKPVLIIGSGLGGLCLAQALKKHNIPFHLFEKDPSLTSRAQGYRLRISEFGLQALEYALTPELWTLFEQTCPETLIGSIFGPGCRLNAVDASALPSSDYRPPQGHGGTRKPYTVDRSTFRRVMMSGIEEEVSFGKGLERYTLREDGGGVTAYFSDGTCVEGAMIVGADGVRSAVRRQLIPRFGVLDTGMRIIYGRTLLNDELVNSSLPKGLLSGMSLVVDQSGETRRTLLLEPIRFPRQNTDLSTPISFPEDYVYWVLLAPKSSISIPDDELLRLNNQQSAQLALDLTSHWDERIRNLFTLQDSTQTSTLRTSSAHPELPLWESSSRVTLLGDAVHVMPPTGGMGANTALRDAGDLAERLVAAKGEYANVIGEYEAGMRKFAKTAIEWSWQGGKNGFGLGEIEDCEVVEL